MCLSPHWPNVHKFENTFDTTWYGLKNAKDWVIDIIKTKSIPTVNPEPLIYTIESTGTYHLPVIKAFGGNPSIANPLLASPLIVKLINWMRDYLHITALQVYGLSRS